MEIPYAVLMLILGTILFVYGFVCYRKKDYYFPACRRGSETDNENSRQCTKEIGKVIMLIAAAPLLSAAAALIFRKIVISMIVLLAWFLIVVLIERKELKKGN